MAISNGDFSGGLWGPTGDCNNILKDQAIPYLRAEIVPSGAPGGLPALRLSASVDSACEIQSLNWRGGSLVLNLMVHALKGAPPRLCLWEFGPERCASLPNIPTKTGWYTYRASVSPDPGTKSIALYLYADATTQNTQTVNEYANVRAIEVQALPTLALLAKPDAEAGSTEQLVVLHDTFSNDWESTGGRHVLVDGMVNGWLLQPGSNPSVATYWPTGFLRAAQWISLVTWLIAFIVAVRRRVGRLARGPFNRLLANCRFMLGK
jgi:arabinofuranan 3-O-arabinosyltransferase